MIKSFRASLSMLLLVAFALVVYPQNKAASFLPPKAVLLPIQKFTFHSFVDCNMAEAWVGNTFRIFPGKYGEDPLWGNAHDLKFADGSTADEAFSRKASEFTEPLLPVNAPPGTPGLHGAVWFETIYQEPDDKSGNTLYALYHNENYPATLPFDPATKKGYKNENWPQGLKGPSTATAVCRIGIMKSVDGGRSWNNKGLFIEDYQSRLILKPHNTAINFAGGVGDPSAVASGAYLYLFYGEYGYPGIYDSATYNPQVEWRGQCISVARISLSDLDNPEGKARRWSGKGFTVPYDSVGVPIAALQIPRAEGGGPASSPAAAYYWGPSLSWNTYLKCWVMLMAKAEGPSWQGNSIYISFNKKADLGYQNNAQAWTPPVLLLKKQGHELWYPSLQPLGSPEDKRSKNTCVKLGEQARLFFKDNHDGKGEYVSEYKVRFEK